MLPENEAVLLQMVENELDLLLYGHLVGVKMNLRLNRCFIRIIDTSEVLDFAGACFFVQALRVTFFGHRERAVYKYLDELKTGLFV
jgi:hypothetical protein